jgi:hypothetical protein
MDLAKPEPKQRFQAVTASKWLDGLKFLEFLRIAPFSASYSLAFLSEVGRDETKKKKVLQGAAVGSPEDYIQRQKTVEE